MRPSAKKRRKRHKRGPAQKLVRTRQQPADIASCVQLTKSLTSRINNTASHLLAGDGHRSNRTRRQLERLINERGALLAKIRLQNKEAWQKLLATLNLSNPLS